MAHQPIGKKTTQSPSILVRIRAKTGARKERIVELSSHSFEVAVKEKAERNEANKRICTLIARHYKVLEKSVHIVSGHTRNRKTIRVIK